MHLIFSDDNNQRTLQVGPAPWFRVSGNFVRKGPNGDIVGTFLQHHWEVQSQFFIRWEASVPTLVHFEDAAGGATQDYGPFASLTSVDGVMRVDGGELFAKFIEETQLWHCYRSANFWPVIVVKRVQATAGTQQTSEGQRRASIQLRRV